MEEWFELTYPATQIFLVICEDISIVSFWDLLHVDDM
jgi:hypothetical protein